MKVTYVDSSVLIAILFGERESQKWQRYLTGRDEIVSSALMEAEVFSAASREGVSLGSVDELLEAVSIILPERSLRAEYHRIFSIGYCRGADAEHLATALYLDPRGREMEFATLDNQQRLVAQKLGMGVV